ncbi:MAG: creatininase family protein [Armatimonadetes bacterium]|nr:creatininase family protein [Armatimonadota bacterium]
MASSARPPREVSRRAAIASAAGATIGLTAGSRSEGAERAAEAVQMQLMRPGQLEAAGKEFPVVYVPFGLIEWHGRHLPMGCDALKAHGILIECARRHGGVVYPPVYFHDGFGRGIMTPVLTRLFVGLKHTGFRVIIGVSGHNVREQIEMIEEALKPVTADGAMRGIGLWEITLSQGPESNTDHAAKWETSDMMHLHPQCVDLTTLGDGPLQLDMKPPDGIGGLDPRKTASAQIGARSVRLAADAIGAKARELLQSLPEDKRAFSIPAVAPGSWWLV